MRSSSSSSRNNCNWRAAVMVCHRLEEALMYCLGALAVLSGCPLRLDQGHYASGHELTRKCDAQRVLQYSLTEAHTCCIVFYSCQFTQPPLKSHAPCIDAHAACHATCHIIFIVTARCICSHASQVPCSLQRHSCHIIFTAAAHLLGFHAPCRDTHAASFSWWSLAL